jgi:alpha-mannosidase
LDSATQREVLVQVLWRQGNQARILFLADVPSIGFKVFEVSTGAPRSHANSLLSVTTSSLENARYKVRIDANGDIESIFDKKQDMNS